MTIVFAILLFSLLIFLHELGHFITAKLSHVQVNEFALFMGPALVKWKRGDTQYSIRCIPIGGYCAMEGEDKDTDNPHSFQKAAWWKRLIILVAGSAMNFITGLLLMAIVFAPAKQFVEPVIAQAEEGCTVVAEDKLHVGDRLVEIDGEKILVAGDFDMILTLNGGDTHDVVVERNGQRVQFENLKMEKHLFPNEEAPRFGFSFSYVDATFGNKISYVWRNACNVVRTVKLSLQMIVRGQAGLQDMTGPVGIVQIMSNTAAASESALDAFMNMLYFGAFIAINLAVMNLLPIPALDGGRVLGLLLTTGIEAVTKKKLDPKYEGYVHGVGMVLLLVLMAVILFKDIFTIVKG